MNEKRDLSFIINRDHNDRTNERNPNGEGVLRF